VLGCWGEALAVFAVREFQRGVSERLELLPPERSKTDQRRAMTAHRERTARKGLDAGILVPSHAGVGLRFRNSRWPQPVSVLEMRSRPGLPASGILI
jgi:hypothetical protein